MFEMTPWNPVEEMMSLREAMNRLLEESLLPTRAIERGGQETGQLTSRAARMLGAPAIDVQDQENVFLVRASLPGVRPEEVRIEARGNHVAISGQIQEEREGERGNFLLRERRVGQFFRTFTLPVDVNSEGAEASFANGVLTLRLPKSEAARSRQIPVRAEGAKQGGNGQTQATGQGQGQAQTIEQGQGQAQTMGQGQGQTMFEQGQRQPPFEQGQRQNPFEQSQEQQRTQG